ncbi:MAG: DUF370 domain-containing protein [Clostridia bacterium]|nr:DUF370 domain-containing protein [Clostridia bacterium]
MYLHVGNKKNIREKDIIGIFDTDSATVSVTTRKYLAGKEKEGMVEAAIEEIPKSFVLYLDEKGDKRICFSQLSPHSLLGRVDFM